MKSIFLSLLLFSPLLSTISANPSIKPKVMAADDDKTWFGVRYYRPRSKAAENESKSEYSYIIGSLSKADVQKFFVDGHSSTWIQFSDVLWWSPEHEGYVKMSSLKPKQSGSMIFSASNIISIAPLKKKPDEVKIGENKPA